MYVFKHIFLLVAHGRVATHFPVSILIHDTKFWWPSFKVAPTLFLSLSFSCTIVGKVESLSFVCPVEFHLNPNSGFHNTSSSLHRPYLLPPFVTSICYLIVHSTDLFLVNVNVSQQKFFVARLS